MKYVTLFRNQQISAQFQFLSSPIEGTSTVVVLQFQTQIKLKLIKNKIESIKLKTQKPL